jgi:hypothetical protein
MAQSHPPAVPQVAEQQLSTGSHLILTLAVYLSIESEHFRSSGNYKRLGMHYTRNYRTYYGIL